MALSTGTEDQVGRYLRRRERTPQGDSCETISNTDSGGPGIKVGTSITTP